MTDKAVVDRWESLVVSKLVGRRITAVRYCTEEEAGANSWHSRPIAIKLDNGMELVPVSDDEGNNGGSIWTNIEGFATIPVM